MPFILNIIEVSCGFLHVMGGEAEEAVTISMARKKRFVFLQRPLNSAWHSETSGGHEERAELFTAQRVRIQGTLNTRLLTQLTSHSLFANSQSQRG